MKKLLFLLSIVFCFAAAAQPTSKPISQLTTLPTSPTGGYVPIVKNNTTYKVPADSIAYLFFIPILDSVKVPNAHSQAYWNTKYKAIGAPEVSDGNKGDVNVSSGVWYTMPKNLTLGTLYDKTTFSSTSDFSNLGATVSASGGVIHFTGGSNNFFQRIVLPSYSGLSKWGVGIGVKILAEGNGLWFGRDPSAISADGCQIRLTTSTGKLSLYDIYGKIAETSDTLAINVNDSIVLRLNVNDYFLNVYAINVTQGKTLSLNFEYTGSSPFVTPANIGRYGVGILGGDFDLYKMNVVGNEIKNADLLVIGDSKTVGFRTDFQYRYCTLLNNYANVVVIAGSSETSANWVQKIPEILALKPKAVLLTNPSNDLRNGVLLSTSHAQYDSIEKVCRAAGIEVYHSNGFFENSAYNPTAWKDWIAATKSIDSIIDTYSVTASNELLYDNVHLNDAGNRAVFNAILYSGKIRFGFDKSKYNNTFFWGTQGNYLGTTDLYPPVRFIGTKDAKDLIFKTSNTTRLTITAAGLINFPSIPYSNSSTDSMLVWNTATQNLGMRAIPVGGTGSGTVGAGNPNRLAYYPSAGTTVGELPAITNNRAIVSDANGLPTHSVTTATEIAYLSGVTSAIQTQLNAKPSRSELGDSARKVLTDSTKNYYLRSTDIVGLKRIMTKPNDSTFVFAGLVAGANITITASVDYKGDTAWTIAAGGGMAIASAITNAKKSSLLYAGTNGYLQGDSTKLSWDSLNIRLAIGAAVSTCTDILTLVSPDNTSVQVRFKTNGYSGFMGMSANGDFYEGVGSTTFSRHTNSTPDLFTHTSSTGLKINGGGSAATSTVDVSGSEAFAISTKTANYTATANDHTLLFNNTSGSVTLTLPAASGCSGRIYYVKKISGASNDVVIDPNSSETIEGISTKTLTTQYDGVIIQSNGTAWFVIAKN